MLGKLEVKNTKSSTLRSIFQLEQCKSINGLKNGGTNETIPKLRFTRHKQDMEAQNGAKRAKFWAN